MATKGLLERIARVRGAGTAPPSPAQKLVSLALHRGATPGPGTGTQLGPDSPAPGRLIIAAHYGA